jgi:hypothetical protein
MNVGDWVGAVQNGVATIAIIGGAAWGYFKFVRGRTFAFRAEPSVTGDLLRNGDKQGIRACVCVKNTGAAKIPLRAKAVYVAALRADGEQEKLAAAAVFEDHENLEAQETISDEVLIPLPDRDDAPAYLLKFLFFERTTKPTAIQWTARAIVPGRLAKPAEAQTEA